MERICPYLPQATPADDVGMNSSVVLDRGGQWCRGRAVSPDCATAAVRVAGRGALRRLSRVRVCDEPHRDAPGHAGARLRGSSGNPAWLDVCELWAHRSGHPVSGVSTEVLALQPSTE